MFIDKVFIDEMLCVWKDFIDEMLCVWKDFTNVSLKNHFIS